MKKISFVILVTCLALLNACAKKQPTIRVTLKAPDNFKGYLRLTPCIASAPKSPVISETGIGITSACPTGDVELVVITPSKTITIAPENVRVRRSRDGEPQIILADIS
jgi:hypothetical protein